MCVGSEPTFPPLAGELCFAIGAISKNLDATSLKANNSNSFLTFLPKELM
jgi:hypothetical protein